MAASDTSRLEAEVEELKKTNETLYNQIKTLSLKLVNGSAGTAV
jgi:cell division protein FtsB